MKIPTTDYDVTRDGSVLEEDDLTRVLRLRKITFLRPTFEMGANKSDEFITRIGINPHAVLKSQKASTRE